MLYNVIEENAVTAALGKSYESFARTHDAVEALHFVLERDPKVAGFELEEAPGVYWIKLPGKPSIQFPKCIAMYVINGDTVTVKSIRLEHDGVIFHSAAFER